MTQINPYGGRGRILLDLLCIIAIFVGIFFLALYESILSVLRE